jgi:hypothetical protein
MAFLGRKRWEAETSVYRLVCELSAGKPWRAYVGLTDDPAEVVEFLRTHPPQRLG